jgi:hypothetical protein
MPGKSFTYRRKNNGPRIEPWIKEVYV